MAKTDLSKTYVESGVIRSLLSQVCKRETLKRETLKQWGKNPVSYFEAPLTRDLELLSRH